jgi:hypothetical protein
MLFTTAAPLPSGVGLAERALTINAPNQASLNHISLDAFDQIHPQILGALCDTARHPAPKWIPAQAAPDPVATAIGKFLNHRSEWTGTATELLESLRATHPNITWPETPKGLTQLLNKTPLGNIDFQSLKDNRSRRTIELRVINPESSRKRHTEKHAPMRVKQIKKAPQSQHKSIPAPASRHG